MQLLNKRCIFVSENGWMLYVLERNVRISRKYELIEKI